MLLPEQKALCLQNLSFSRTNKNGFVFVLMYFWLRPVAFHSFFQTFKGKVYTSSDNMCFFVRKKVIHKNVSAVSDQFHLKSEQTQDLDVVWRLQKLVLRRNHTVWFSPAVKLCSAPCGISVRHRPSVAPCRLRTQSMGTTLETFSWATESFVCTCCGSAAGRPLSVCPSVCHFVVFFVNLSVFYFENRKLHGSLRGFQLVTLYIKLCKLHIPTQNFAQNMSCSLQLLQREEENGK